MKDTQPTTSDAYREPTSTSAAYVHVPFCRHRCGYCNFTLIAGRDDLQQHYLDALELELSGLSRPHEVQTLFVGGGTPTQLRPALLRRFLDLLARWLPLAPSGEFSVEANPNDLDAACVETLAAAGVGRVSLGVQSFQPRLLQVLERDHSRESALAAIERASEAFTSVSLDLIFAVPGGSLDDWRSDLQIGADCGADHLSTYGLTFDKGSAFWSRRERGALNAADEELERRMYLEAIEFLESRGLEHYEVSNFARSGHRCRHNVNYWLGGNYLAFGPGAARHERGRREVNHRSTTAYIRRMQAGQSPVAEREILGPRDRAKELLIFALRMRAGVGRDWFRNRTGYDLDQLAGDAIRAHVAAGRMHDDGVTVQLSLEGLLVSDAVLVDFV